MNMNRPPICPMLVGLSMMLILAVVGCESSPEPVGEPAASTGGGRLDRL
jgi:hypothetical protein